MDINEILKSLPHRYPFMLIDRVVEVLPRQSILALKNVTYNEPFFPGHFPGRPVMPGVMMVEAMAQASGILALASMDAPPTGDGALVYLGGVDKARFKRPVEPGDQLHIQMEYVKHMRGVWKFSGEARVDGQLAVSADITAVLAGNED